MANLCGIGTMCSASGGVSMIIFQSDGLPKNADIIEVLRESVNRDRVEEWNKSCSVSSYCKQIYKPVLAVVSNENADFYEDGRTVSYENRAVSEIS